MLKEPAVQIRRATGEDAIEIVGILQKIAAERVYSAIDAPWTPEEERSYVESLSPREVVHVATAGSGDIVGFQSLDLWEPTIASMKHVAQIGTFLLAEWRRRGVGKALFASTKEFANSAGYAKAVIQIRASNQAAQRFYRQLGFCLWMPEGPGAD